MSLSNSNSIFSEALGTLVMRMAGVALTFFSTLVLARLFGPVEYGAYRAALALASLLAALAPLGSDRILVRNVSTTKCTVETGRETAIAHLCTGIMTAVLVIGLFTAWAVNSFSSGSSGWSRTVLLATVMFVPRTMMSLRQWLAIPIIGSRRAVMPELTVLPLIFTLSLLLLTAIGLKLTADTAAVVYGAMTIIVWFGSLQTGPIRVVYSSAWAAMRHTRRSDVIRQFRNGLPFVSVGIGAVLTQSCMPIVIAATCGFKDAAFFVLAFSYAALATMPLPAFNLSMIPRCARLYRLGDFAGAQHAVRSAATVTFSVAATLSIVMWIASPLLTTLLGSDYSVVCRLLPALLLSMIVDCLTGPTNPVLQAMNMENTHSRVLLAFIPLQFGAVYLFGTVAGIEGAGIAFLVSRCLWNVVVFSRIYQVRGLVMLPYLDVTRAFGADSPSSEGKASQRQCRQSRWQAVASPEVSASDVRAA